MGDPAGGGRPRLCANDRGFSLPEERPYRDAVHRHRKNASPEADEDDKPKRRPALWAELLRRTFGVDVLHCPLCGGRR